MDGNSLGLPSREAEGAVLQALDEWRRRGRRVGWRGRLPGSPWESVWAELQAELMGAHPDEVVATASTTVNLHNLVATFYRPKGRGGGCWPTSSTSPPTSTPSRARCASTAWTRRRTCGWCAAATGARLDEDDIVAAMTDEVALVVLPGVLYRSGQLLDMERLTAEAHARGILIGFDSATRRGRCRTGSPPGTSTSPFGARTST